MCFAFYLGDAKDDAKLKKCVSTRYATVLILLTVKCECCLDLSISVTSLVKISFLIERVNRDTQILRSVLFFG